MRSKLMLLCLAIAASALLAFTLNSDPPYDQLLAENYKAEFFKKMTSEQLRTNLSDVYSHDFDRIEVVDLHKAADESYYYVAYGQKDNKSIASLITVSEELAMNQFYPSRADMGIGANDAVINCYCFWFVCSTEGKPSDKVCGLALDRSEPCKPAFCTFEGKPIETN